MPPRTKYASREHRAQIRAVLLRDWDPIGVQDAEQAQDEYDSYIAMSYLMLLDDADEATIAADLLAISHGHMGLRPLDYLDQAAATAAASLMRLRPGFPLY